jgi:hypothetical protein
MRSQVPFLDHPREDIPTKVTVRAAHARQLADKPPRLLFELSRRIAKGLNPLPDGHPNMAT